MIQRLLSLAGAILLLPATAWADRIVVKGQLNSQPYPYFDLSLTSIPPGQFSDRCAHTSPPTQGEEEICSFYVEKPVKDLRLELKMPGYKIFTRNVADLKFEYGRATIDLGNVVMVPTEMPKIEQIVYGQDRKGNRRFQITLHNPLKKRVLITKLVLSKFFQGARCCDGPPEVIMNFIISDTLKVIGGGSRKKSVQGTFTSGRGGQEFKIPANGTYEHSDRRSYFRLELPTSFLLPAQDYAAVDVILPKNFSIRGETKPNVDDLPSLNYIDFTFVPNQADELPIKGTYTFRQPSSPDLASD